jgi:hypothetical protein
MPPVTMKDTPLIDPETDVVLEWSLSKHIPMKKACQPEGRNACTKICKKKVYLINHIWEVRVVHLMRRQVTQEKPAQNAEVVKCK